MKKIYFFKTKSLQLKFYKIKIYQKKFCKKYGHLRPNTYDILSKIIEKTIIFF